ncbi:hypothetical protein HELRODRAFT_185407 [Helobdella robusta]|uniref:Synaptobrevin homolog YKT6 n=1 Tax=Helobdella robusta TaxID=6412 RepID=T1FMS0_HELRO|nr:hypothetical protein HELRODRAFT_185407 [Helobdella robusta]ESO07874.1 hypothetical protein HELRODRAFT_185407 [Helobdella robusta]
MKLFAINILYKGTNGKVKKLTGSSELSSFGFFQRSSAQEFMDFTSKIIVERTNTSQRSSVKEQEYVCHLYVRGDSLAGVVISDDEYPSRVSFTLLNKVLDDFSAKYPAHQWPDAQENSLPFTELAEFLQKYQNPKEADAMTRIQSDLDETKIILHNTIESVLERGEKLDDLVAKSEGLTYQSKAFYKTAKKTNSCCVLL